MEKTPHEDKAAAASKSDAPATAYKYVGDGTYLPGVPARDLSKDEFDALSDEQKETLKQSGLYKKGAR